MTLDDVYEILSTINDNLATYDTAQVAQLQSIIDNQSQLINAMVLFISINIIVMLWRLYTHD